MTVLLRAPAKLTLSLRITGVRDDGFHLIDAEMVSLDLDDELELDPAGSGVRVVRPDGEAPAAEDDLVVRALAVAGRVAGVRLHKRIPAGTCEPAVAAPLEQNRTNETLPRTAEPEPATPAPTMGSIQSASSTREPAPRLNRHQRRTLAALRRKAA